MQSGDVIIEKDLSALGSDRVADYVAHIYCHDGGCSFVFNEKQFGIHAGNCAIITITKLVYDVKPDSDFSATVIYVSNAFLAQSSPESNYSSKGVMLLYQNPVIWLDPRRRRNVPNRFNEPTRHRHGQLLGYEFREVSD